MAWTTCFLGWLVETLLDLILEYDGPDDLSSLIDSQKLFAIELSAVSVCGYL